MENKQNREVESEDELRHLEFVAIGQQQYGVFNMRTGRFHNLDLGIDIITDSQGRVLALEVSE